MQRQRLFLAWLGLLVAVGLSLPVAGAATAQTDLAPVNRITIRAQAANTNQIVVDSVIASQDGWIIIYTDPCGSTCAMIGYAPVHRGQNTHFTVDIDSSRAEPFSTLWAMLHVDRNILGRPPEWPGPDEPVWQDDHPVMVAFATQEQPQPRPTPTLPRPGAGYAKLEADFQVYNWRKSETPGDLIGAMQVYATGGDGHYTYGFIGTHTVNTFDFRWRACSALVESLHVSSGDGQMIAVPVWRDDLPCPKHWDDDDECDDCDCNCPCTCSCDCDCP